MTLPEPYYQDHACTIYCGDCNELFGLLPCVDLCLTDPPYGIGDLMKGGKNTGHWNFLSSGNSWDMKAPDLKPMMGLGKETIIWGGNYFPLPPSRGVLAWIKLNAVPTQSAFELAWTTFDMPAKLFRYPSGGAIKRHGHPTEKPVELMRWCIGFAPNAQTILDPFMGSGTTLRAAKDLGRRAIGIEINEEYCAIAVERLRQEVLGI